jgi:16S rRNA G1207 methylase RsmC
MLRWVNIEPQDKVLDLGCGSDVVAIYAADRTDPTSVWPVDVERESPAASSGRHEPETPETCVSNTCQNVPAVRAPFRRFLPQIATAKSAR